MLDECHHLASLWGYVVRAALAELGGVHVIGADRDAAGRADRGRDRALRRAARPGRLHRAHPGAGARRALAPYQELAWLTRPLDSEAAWLAEHDLRFTELITSLHEESAGTLTLPDWVISRIGTGPAEGEEATVSWAGVPARAPGTGPGQRRFLASGGLELPPGVPRGEGYREPPDLDDWLVLLEDYALRCLAADSGDAAAGAVPASRGRACASSASR